MPHQRLIEARSIITHGLGEAGLAGHEQYITEFRQMTAQIERMYGIWLIDRRPIAEPVVQQETVEP